MKLRLLLTVCLLACVGIANAQPPRLVGSVHYESHMPIMLTLVDTTSFGYKSSNKTIGDAGDYLKGTLIADTSIDLYNDGTGKLYYKNRTRYVYNAQKLLIEKVSQTPQPAYNDPLVNKERSILLYNSNSDIEIQYSFRWDVNSSGMWDTAYRDVYQYDANKNLTVYNSAFYDIPGGWRADKRRTYVYDINNNVTLYVGEQWNSSIGKFDSSVRQTSTYDISNNNDTLLYENYNATLGKWAIEGRGCYAYDVNGNRLSYTYQEWKSSSFVNVLLEEYYYNSQNELEYTDKKSWVSGTLSWSDADRDSLYTEMVGGLKEEHRLQLFWDHSSQSRLKGDHFVQRYNAFGQLQSSVKGYDGPGKWIINDSIYYHYAQPVGIYSTQAYEDLMVYPNPATHTLMLKTAVQGEQTAVISITDMSGRLVKKWNATLKPAMNITVAEMTAGQYILNIQGGDIQQSVLFSIVR